METKVTLLSHTADPLETIWSVWETSRNNKPVVSPRFVAERRAADPRFDKEVRDLFSRILEAGIPVAENVSFTFLLEGVSISLREQLVRHRIGVHVGERMGCDIVPDLADSTWWSQSMRILEMGEFADHKAFHVPESIQGEGRKIFSSAMEQAQESYQSLVALGVPLEDARNVIPLAATHRLTWTLNLAALKHICGKRGCWILQLGLWKPVIVGMLNELATKIDPIFLELITPPCIKGGKFQDCLFHLDNERRVLGEDEIPPCLLWLTQCKPRAFETYEREVEQGKLHAWVPTIAGPWACLDLQKLQRQRKMAEEYGRLWGRNVETGEKLS